jgi:hypothetical protein
LDVTHRVTSASPGPDGQAAAQVPASEESPREVGANQEWRVYLQEACKLLWPSPAVLTIEGPGGGGLRLAFSPGKWGRVRPPDGEFALLPGILRPPLLVPAASAAAASAMRYFGGSRSPAVRLTANALSAALANGLGRPALRGHVHVTAPPGAETIEVYLSTVMSQQIRVSMYLGPARANRKPVLELHTETGEPSGFAKVGINPLTRALVHAERDSLARLGEAGLTGITIPKVLHYGTWHGLNVLVMSALPTPLPRRPLPAPRLSAAMRELASVGGLQQEPLAKSRYLQRLRARLSEADDSADREALGKALDTLAGRANGTVLVFGAWHGDWAPWNMANTDRGLLVWDWERFTCGVPMGFDALHCWLQAQLGIRHGKPRATAARCLENAPRLLAPFGIPAEEARLTAALYLTDLATRYLADRQAEAGARLGGPGSWLLPALAEEVRR